MWRITLDLCCGTGDVSFALADSGTQVTGLDFSQVMLDYAKVRDELTRVTFQRGDALATGFPDNHFEIVTIAYGLRNLADFEGGLREMYRVAKPGGRIMVLDFGKPSRARRWAFHLSKVDGPGVRENLLPRRRLVPLHS